MSGKKSVIFIIIPVLLYLFVSPGCKEKTPIRMATTTSTDNTGLLDYLKGPIEDDLSIEITWVAVGTGRALELGKNCDVDILLVHAPGAEKKYISNGHGTDRTEIMYNDFIIIGPQSDPAAIKGKSVQEAFASIYRKKAVFVSRGDNSGTHKKEILLWKTSKVPVPEKQKWYMQTGQGMINTINIAVESRGYTITDRGTFIKYMSKQKGDDLPVILVEGDESLVNQYSVIAVNPQKCKNVRYDTAKKIITWFAGKKGQQLIKDFRLMGKPLFIPNYSN